MIIDKENGIPISYIYSVLKKRILIIALCVIIGAAGAFMYARYIIDKEYTVSAILFVTPNKENQNAAAQTALSELNYLQKVVVSYLATLKTEFFLNEVMKQSNLNYPADQLDQMVELSVIDETEFFSLKVTSANPADALVIAESFINLAPVFVSEINPADSIRVLSPAKLPTQPSGPNMLKNIAIGLIAGVMIGVMLAFIQNKMDKHVKSTDDLLEHFSVPILGTVLFSSRKLEPMLGAKSNVISVARYKTILTKLLTEQDSGLRRIMVTSPEENTVKSTNCYNLGILLAQTTQANVLIIDCNYRRMKSKNDNELKKSVLFKYFGLKQVPGLSEMLTENAKHIQLISKTEVARLDILGHGKIPAYPADLLASSAMQNMINELSARYDYILLEGPALNMNSDALVLSRYIDGIILAVSQEKTTYEVLGNALGKLMINNLKLAGIIFNGEQKRNP